MTGKISSGVSLVLVLVMLSSLVPVGGLVGAQEDIMEQRAFLPLVLRPPESPPPSPDTIRVYDASGEERDMAWLRSRYGDFVIQPAAEGDGPVYKISALRERVDSSTLSVRVVDADGAPVAATQVAFYWSGADEDADCGPLGGVLPGMVPNRCVNGATNANGDAGFGMGNGAYYSPDQGQIGPHAVWVYGSATRSDLILGLGMVAGTDYDHFDVEFTRYDEGPDPTPTPPPDSIQVFDADGVERDLAWLQAKYGDFIIQPAAEGAGPLYKITVLRERVDSSTLVVRVTDADGIPQAGVQVAFYWSDAPQDADCGPAGGVLPGMVPNRCELGPTEANGDAGFGMGPGAYYWPDQGQIGPHATWVYGASTRSDLILGLGMVAATNHNHFDVEFTRY